VVARPFDLSPEHAMYAEPAPKEFAEFYCTYCGT